jgi:pimeloyl-ACP methyl ester carboxylesterase
MYKKTLLSLAIASTIALTGCLENDKKENDNGNAESNPNGLTQGQIAELEAAAGTYAVFNPMVPELPIPSDLNVDRSVAADDNPQEGADGTYSSSALLASLDFLDGAGTSAAYDIRISSTINASAVTGDYTDVVNGIVDGRAFIPHPDPAQGGYLIPNPNQNVFLLDLTYPGGDELIATDGIDLDNDGIDDLTETPTFQAGILYKTYQATVAAILGAGGDMSNAAIVSAADNLLDNVNFRAEVASQGDVDNVIRILPRTPLNAESKYLVIITNEIKDSQGNKIAASPTYKNLTDPTATLLSAALSPVRLAIQSWELLAEGWFNATINTVRQTFRDANPALAEIYTDLDENNVALAITFTTGGTDTVLNAMTAPETFFTKSATITAKQNGIASLIGSNIALNASEIGAENIATADLCLNSIFLGTITNSANAATGAYIPELDSSSADYDPTLLYYSDLTDSTHKFVAQSVAAGGQYAIENDNGTLASGLAPGLEACAGIDDSTTIAATSTGTTNALVDAGFLAKPVSGITDKLDLSGSGLSGVTFHDTFIPIAATSTGTLNDYRLTSSSLNDAFVNPGYVMQGQIDLPYYLPSAEEAADAANVATGTWVANDSPALGAPSTKVTYRFPFAKETGTETVPFILSTPDEAFVTKPANGWPVVIFQHGIFGQRGDGLPLANALGAACLSGGANPGNVEVANPAGQDAPRCFATISIDMPLHGVAPTRLGGTLDALALGGLSVDVEGEPDFAARDWSATHYAGLHERHFNWSKAADGTPTEMIYGTDINDAVGNAGEFYINLGLPPASRDNLRQSALDLVSLTASLADIDLDGTANKDVDGNIVDRDLDTDRVYLLGHSLGGIVGTTFAATNNNLDVQAANATLPDLKAVAFETSGGQIIRILENSDFLSAPILAGLANFGLQPQTPKFELFLNIAQAAIESGDSINYAAKLNATGTPILATEVFGDGTVETTQDQIIPPGADLADGTYLGPKGTALNSPLAGTEPFIQELNLTSITVPGLYEPGSAVQAVVRKSAGGHTTISTADNLTAFTEIATEYATFFSSQGQEVAVGDVTDSNGVDTDTVISATTPDISN